MEYIGLKTVTHFFGQCQLYSFFVGWLQSFYKVWPELRGLAPSTHQDGRAGDPWMVSECPESFQCHCTELAWPPDEYLASATHRAGLDVNLSWRDRAFACAHFLHLNLPQPGLRLTTLSFRTTANSLSISGTPTPRRPTAWICRYKQFTAKFPKLRKKTEFSTQLWQAILINTSGRFNQSPSEEV